jgi:hypothetical protein
MKTENNNHRRFIMKTNRFSQLAASLALAITFTSNLFAQTVLTPHFTEQSKKIVIPKDGSVFPEIHDGLIAVSNYPKIYYVNTKGEYVFGSNFPLSRKNDYVSAYFSGGAMMAWRTKPNEYSPLPFIIYPDGKYRDLAKDISDASAFVDGYALVHKGQSVVMGVKQVFIDKNGKDVFPALTSTQRGTFGDLNVYPLREKRRLYYNAELGKYGYADEKGAVAIKPQFEKAENFSEGLAAVKITDNSGAKWGFINTAGKVVIPATYKLKPGRFSDSLAAVRIGDDEFNYEMAYIDKTGKRVMENKKWDLNEFSNGYAWVGTGCEKLFVINKKFEEVSNLTKLFHGADVCSFKMIFGNVQNPQWGFDFPEGKRALNQDGIAHGDIFAPNGTVLFTAKDAKGNRVWLNDITEGGLIFCEASFINESRLKEKDVFMPVFINQQGEVVYFFEKGVEGYEGGKNTQLK